ncbi:hypothetical protein ACFJIX_20980 [Roseateles sp. UC29_93]|uniref:hypothetical protein n=1 Tax=Roseateles sp. UC29_93 TaxID=3350177 RepID=UPI003671B0D3
MAASLDNGMVAVASVPTRPVSFSMLAGSLSIESVAMKTLARMSDGGAAMLPLGGTAAGLAPSTAPAVQVWSTASTFIDGAIASEAQVSARTAFTAPSPLATMRSLGSILRAPLPI